MIITIAKGLYPDFIGKRSIFAGAGAGPVAYNSTLGDQVSVNINPYYIDGLNGGVLDTTGTYIALPIQKVLGERQPWYLFYTVRSTGLPVANGTNLSAFNFPMGGLGGQF